MGLSTEEINDKFDAIVEFSGLKDFIDVPILNYSSGMSVRLGFSVAVHCELDILLMDEVLAVGDEGFKKKCVEKIEELQEHTSTIFVSHDQALVERVCDRIIVLDKGKVTSTINQG